MKKVILALFLFIFQSILAQETITKDLGDFSSVKIFDRISVELIQSDQNKIEISGKKNQEVELVNKNGDLKIRLPLQKLFKGEELKAKLYFKSIDNIEVSEGSYVHSNNVFKGISFNVNAKEGAQIDINLDVDKIDVRVNSGGNITLLGKAKIQDIVVTSGGIVNGKDLETKQTNVSVNAGGNVSLNAMDLVDAKTRAGGIITIYGNPKKINKKTILGGTIKEIK